MRRVIILLLVGVIFGFTAPSYDGTPLRFAEIEIIKAPSKEPRNPYQTEYEQMLYPTVRITAGWSTGSGVIIATTEKPQITQISIISAAHVVADLSIVNIELYNSEILTGTVIITDTIKDIALIKSEISTDSKTKIYTGKLADKDYQYFLFTPVYAVGCSLGLPPRPSSGILSALSASVVEITAPILPGNSGGPVFDARTYEVIGIAVWVKVYDGQLVTTMAGVVPITEIYDFLESYKRLQ